LRKISRDFFEKRKKKIPRHFYRVQRQANQGPQASSGHPVEFLTYVREDEHGDVERHTKEEADEAHEKDAHPVAAREPSYLNNNRYHNKRYGFLIQIDITFRIQKYIVLHILFESSKHEFQRIK
jgi:hypothetical protein